MGHIRRVSDERLVKMEWEEKIARTAPSKLERQ